MKLKQLFILFILSSGLFRAQNFVTTYSSAPKCFGECNGSITFTTSAVTGPFTASLTNGSGCSNVITQTSSVNSITIGGICACAGNYTANIYNPGMAIVGSMVFQFINYAVAPLVVNTNTFTQATCSNCCDGDVTFTVTGGNTTTAVTYSIDGVYNPSVNPTYFLCVGNHTVCVEDNSGCIACKVFYMPYVGGPTALKEILGNDDFVLSPNPAAGDLYIESGPASSFSKAEIFDMTGRKVFAVPLSGNKAKLDAGALQSGMYYIVIYGSEGTIPKCKKFTKTD